MNAQAHTLPDPAADAANDAAAPALWIAVSVSEEFMSVDSYDARGVPNGRYRLTVPAEVPEGCTPTDARVLRTANHAHVAEIERLRALLDSRPSIASVTAPEFVAWTEQVYGSDKAAGRPAAAAGRYLPVVEMREPAPERVRFAEPALVDQPEAEIAALEREHMGDPDKGTGIYAMPFPGCRCEACVPQGNPFDETRVNVRMILCATCGNKRCPHATDHRNACTDSNEPGQPGSSYAHVRPWPTSESITMIEQSPAEAEAARVLATSPMPR